MALERLRAAASAAARVRALVPAGASVAAEVTAIINEVRVRGDEALLELEARFGNHGPLLAAPDEVRWALESLDDELAHALERAAENVSAVAAAGRGVEQTLPLPQGHSVRLREIPVARAAVYAPGGQAPYPSSVVMGVATARAAGVPDLAVCATHPLMIGAAALCGADRIYRMGGAHAIAALAYGTETVEPVDVIVGPGGLYAQEAKRQVFGQVGIDGFAGPSDLVVIATAAPELVALDMLAQSEHGAGTVVALASPDAGLIDAVERRVARAGEAAVALLHGPLDDCLAFAEAFAPEHLQLVGADAEALAPRVTRAGCLFVGAASGTAFGDYVAGSNHVLPTEGAARFASGLNVRHFTRVMAEVRIGDAAPQLAPLGATIARAEGFAVHAESMQARVRENGTP